MNFHTLIHALFALMVLTVRLDAVPPLVSGDVPTAEKGTLEIYAGAVYQSEGGSVNRELPAVELVYGVSASQEVTLEIPYLSQQGEQGFGDTIVGTKYNFLKEAETWPGVSLSIEVKLPSASASRGFGTGTVDYDMRMRFQKTWRRFTAMGNIGYTVVGEPEMHGVTQSRKNVLFTSAVLEYEVSAEIRLLSEVYLETSEEPGQPNRLAANLGIEREVSHNLTLQAAIGKSLREGNVGGPGLRFYAGLHWCFDTPWRRHSNQSPL